MFIRRPHLHSGTQAEKIFLFVYLTCINPIKEHSFFGTHSQDKCVDVSFESHTQYYSQGTLFIINPNWTHQILHNRRTNTILEYINTTNYSIAMAMNN